MMRATTLPFWFALQFLTRIPVPVCLPNDASLAGRSLLAYPLVGGVIGLILVAIGWLMPGISANTLAAIILLVWVLLTGALHLDGLADCADAWIGGCGDQQRTRQILKDPHVGSAAVAVLIGVLLAKFSGLQNLLAQPDKLEMLFWTPVLARSAALALLIITPYANPHGLASTWLEHLPLPFAKIWLSLIMLILVWRLGGLVLLPAILVFYGVRALALARLDGVTGDVCGALVELIETTLLLSSTA